MGVKKERFNLKNQIKKNIEFRNKQGIFIDKKENKKMDEADKLRIYGKPKAPVISANIEQKEIIEIKKVNTFSLSRKIPKKIFFYWSGCDLSWMRYMTIFSFRKMNPDWDITLFVSNNNVKDKAWKGTDEQDYYMYTGSSYFSKLKELNIKIEMVEFPKEVQDKLKNISPVHESDLFRYYQLFVGGGFYCDMDVLFFRPIDDFYNKIVDGGYDTIIHEYQSKTDYKVWWLTIGFLGASINNEYYKKLFEFGVNNYNESDYQSMGVHLIYKKFGHSPFTQIYNKIISKYSNLKFYNLSTTLLYGLDWTKVDYSFSRSLGINEFNLNSIGYHWYGGHATSQKYNNILNENNHNEYKTTFSKIANEVIKTKTDKNGCILIKNQKPKISIITSYFDRKKQFFETLKSIEKSEFKNFELIVVDDCSSPEHRLEEYLEEFSFLKIIRLEKEDKWYVNPCVPFNVGIRAAVGDIIIIQNPECLHVHDVLSYVNKNIDDTKYITMSTFSLDEKLTNELYKYCENNTIPNLLKTLPQGITNDVGWYNHSKHRPCYYHFCSAMTRKNMKKLGGFDERYAKGIEYDDNEFLLRIKRLGLNLSISDDISVVHQYHPRAFYSMPNLDELRNKNRLLYYGVTTLETDYEVNKK